MKTSRILAPIVLLGVFATSCIGPMKAFNGILNWNSQVSEEKWLNELLFLPVYAIGLPLAGLGDVLIFNAFEFWGGENPIGDPIPYKHQNPPSGD
jgi:Domain of unknown function (DUF3332)